MKVINRDENKGCSYNLPSIEDYLSCKGSNPSNFRVLVNKYLLISVDLWIPFKAVFECLN